MPTTQAIDVQDIDHLGIVAGIVDEIGLVEIVDELLGTHEQEQVSSGQVVKALILNCMGFLTAPLYLFSQFFEGKATEHLIGEGIEPKHLNDTRIGRVLDKLYQYGVTKLFVIIALAVVKKFGITLNCAHLDATSMSVEGQYLEQQTLSTPAIESNQPESESALADIPPETPFLAQGEEDVIPVKITHGYSRDNRSDLKQFVLNLITSGDGDIPLFLQVGHGNDSDKSTFASIIDEFKRQWSQQQPQVFVADAALYSAGNLEALGTTPWISRVPASLIAAQTLLQTLQANLFHPSVLKGYAFAEVCTTYAGIRQRWSIVESQARKEADLKQLQKRIDQSLKEQSAALNKLQAKAFGCETDAQTAAQVFGKTLKYHALSDITIHKTPHYAQAGRPAQGAAPIQYTYHLQVSLILNDSVVEKHRNQAGRFILATNLLDEQSWSNEALLREYKNQQSCERGFRFLKDPLFFASSVFLKTPRRIVALAMIMGLALMVYSLGQRQLRQALNQAQATLPNQKGKPTERPTLRWILQCFQSVHLVWLNGFKHLIKLNDRQQLILSFLGAECKKYYLLC